MNVSNDLMALIFELQRARTPGDKARAMARAWRTIRRLKPTERRLLAREVGFEGAEELVEGLAGKGGGSLAPAAVLEALGRMRKDRSLSLRGVLADLRDPEKREDLLVRGIDLVTDAVVDEPPHDGRAAADRRSPPLPDDPVAGSEGAFDTETPEPVVPEDGHGPRSEEDAARTMVPESMARPIDPAWSAALDEEVSESLGERVPEVELDSVIAAPPKPGPETGSDSEPVVEPVSGAGSEPGPVTASVDEGPSPWDEIWQPLEAVPVVVSEKETKPPRSVPTLAEATTRVEGSVLVRLRRFRDRLDELRGAEPSALKTVLHELAEPWAKRRALVALIEAGIPTSVDHALDLIEALERPMDRRWCLSALAASGRLSGTRLERALGMIASPAAQRRLAELAG
jgi:hypothetical protein